MISFFLKTMFLMTALTTLNTTLHASCESMYSENFEPAETKKYNLAQLRQKYWTAVVRKEFVLKYQSTIDNIKALLKSPTADGEAEKEDWTLLEEDKVIAWMIHIGGTFWLWSPNYVIDSTNLNVKLRRLTEMWDQVANHIENDLELAKCELLKAEVESYQTYTDRLTALFKQIRQLGTYDSEKKKSYLEELVSIGDSVNEETKIPEQIRSHLATITQFGSYFIDAKALRKQIKFLHNNQEPVQDPFLIFEASIRPEEERDIYLLYIEMAIYTRNAKLITDFLYQEIHSLMEEIK